MKISSREVQEVTVLDLSGDFSRRETYVSVRERVRGLLADDKKKILINLAGLERMDSGGLATLVEAFVSTRKQDGALKLVNVSDRIRKLLTLTKLVSLFEIHDTEEQALASFQ